MSPPLAFSFIGAFVFLFNSLTCDVLDKHLSFNMILVSVYGSLRWCRKISNRVSELRVVELLDGLCEKMQDYTLEKVISCLKPISFFVPILLNVTAHLCLFNVMNWFVLEKYILGLKNSGY